MFRSHMHLDSAKELRDNLQIEMDAYGDFGFVVPYVVTMEISRLDEEIARESMRSISHDPFQIAIEDPSMIVNLSNRFGLKNIPSLDGFRKKLSMELHDGIENFYQPLPLTSEFIQRVIKRLEEEINSQRYAEFLHSRCEGRRSRL